MNKYLVVVAVVVVEKVLEGKKSHTNLHFLWAKRPPSVGPRRIGEAAPVMPWPGLTSPQRAPPSACDLVRRYFTRPPSKFIFTRILNSVNLSPHIKTTNRQRIISTALRFGEAFFECKNVTRYPHLSIQSNSSETKRIHQVMCW